MVPDVGAAVALDAVAKRRGHDGAALGEPDGPADDLAGEDVFDIDDLGGEGAAVAGVRDAPRLEGEAVGDVDLARLHVGGVAHGVGHDGAQLLAGAPAPLALDGADFLEEAGGLVVGGALPRGEHLGQLLHRPGHAGLYGLAVAGEKGLAPGGDLARVGGGVDAAVFGGKGGGVLAVLEPFGPPAHEGALGDPPPQERHLDVHRAHPERRDIPVFPCPCMFHLLISAYFGA